MFKNAGYYFVALLLFAVIGFWIPWYSNIFGDHSLWKNFHATLMTLWLLMLITQAFLMRSGRRKEHRTLGKVSFILGPLCIISFPLLTMSNLPPEGVAVLPFKSYILWLQIGTGILFAWFFIAAIYYRKQSALHARYMIATALTTIDPIVARFMIFYGPGAGTVPDMTVAPVMMQYISYTILNIVIIAMLFMDRKEKSGGGVFKKVFAGLIVYEILTFTLAISQPWLNFTNWLAAI